jgi:hypothetical protein
LDWNRVASKKHYDILYRWYDLLTDKCNKYKLM